MARGWFSNAKDGFLMAKGGKSKAKGFVCGTEGCPRQGKPLKVIRTTQRRGFVLRRRRCLECDFRGTTTERWAGERGDDLAAMGGLPLGTLLSWARQYRSFATPGGLEYFQAQRGEAQ